MNLKDQIQNHPLTVVAAAFVAGASGAWIDANEILVKPRDYDIQRQKETIAELTSKPQTSQAIPASQPSTFHLKFKPDQVDSLAPIQPITLETLPHLTSANFEAAIKSLRKSNILGGK